MLLDISALFTSSVMKDMCQKWKVKLPGRFTHRGLNAWGRCSGDRENVFGVGNCCYVASVRRRARTMGAHGTGEERAGAYRVATRTACFATDLHHWWLVWLFVQFRMIAVIRRPSNGYY